MRVRDHFRAHGRRGVTLAATIRDEVADEPRATVKNVGLGGACVELPIDSAAEGALLRLDHAVTLEVVAPTLWDPLVLRGRIAWLRRSTADKPARVGLRFEHREEGSLFALFQLLGAT
jgi:hypothetical protein